MMRLLTGVVGRVVVGVLAFTAIGGVSHGASGASSQITTNLSGAELFAVACASCHGLAGGSRVFTSDGQTIKEPVITYTRKIHQELRPVDPRGDHERA